MSAEPDIVNRIATELDRLDPDPGRPAAPSRPPRRPPRRKGAVELATAAELKALPPALARGTLAATALVAARRVDDLSALGDGADDRNLVAYMRELRMHMADLAERAPAVVPGSVTDEMRERRELRLQQAAAE
jgi:hypothetical protein